MLTEKFNDCADYNPDGLLDNLRTALALRNDAALARALRVKPPTISKVRTRALPVSAAFMLRCHEVSQIPVAQLRRWVGAKAF